MKQVGVEILTILEPLMCLLALGALIRAREARSYWFLTSLLLVQFFSDAIDFALMQLVNAKILSPDIGYPLYFYSYWFSFALESLLSLYVILSIFRLAMAPLRGLQSLGMLVFRWAVGISLALALTTGLGSSRTGTGLIELFVSRFSQISEVLTLCLLLFVCFAMKPLGMGWKSRAFGVSIGLGIAAAGELLATAWFAHSKLYSMENIIMGTSGVCSLSIWTAYFLLPEPKRRIIVLPTTSPFLRWNQISEALGDEPGFVAVAGVPPELFSQAEIEIMARASAKMEPAELADGKPVDESPALIA